MILNLQGAIAKKFRALSVAHRTGCFIYVNSVVEEEFFGADNQVASEARSKWWERTTSAVPLQKQMWNHGIKINPCDLGIQFIFN